MSKNGVIFDIVMSYPLLSKTKAKELHSLKSKKERDRLGLFLAEGSKCVIDLLNYFQPEYLIVTQEWELKHKELAEKFKDKIFIGDKRVFEIISSLNSLPDVIAVFKKREPEKDKIFVKEDSLYLLLDEIQDPGNLGTIIRTCDWFGIYDIFASRNTVDAYSPKVVQATMGSLGRVRVTYLDLKDLITKNRNIQLIGALLKGKPLPEIGKISSGFILMGNEGRGISDDLKLLVDLPLTILPANIANHPDSLNVAVSTAIIISHIK